MQVWIHLNGIQQGPYTLDQLRLLSLDPTTPVWYEGLPQWMPAGKAPLTATMFESSEEATTEPEPEEAAVEETVVLVEEEPAEPRHEQTPIAQAERRPEAEPRSPRAPEGYDVASGHVSVDAFTGEKTVVPRKPPTFLVGCIILTVLGFCPVAAVGIITGILSSVRYNQGRYEKAMKLSRATEWLLIVAIVWGVIVFPVTAAVWL